MEGTNKAHENGEAMGLVGVRLTAQLGAGFKALVLAFVVETARNVGYKLKYCTLVVMPLVPMV